MKQTATPYTPRTILATPAATLGEPLPRVAIGKACLIAKAVTLLDKMHPGQSKPLPLPLKYVVQKAITNAHKTRDGKYAMRCQFDSTDTLRVWRVA